MKLHFGGLPKPLTDAELKALILPFGQPTTVEIAKNPDGTSQGYGFAEFANDDQAKAVIAGLAGKDMAGQPLRVGEARPRKSDKPRTAPRT